MPRAGDKVCPAPRLLSDDERDHINACGGLSSQAQSQSHAVPSCLVEPPGGAYGSRCPGHPLACYIGTSSGGTQASEGFVLLRFSGICVL